MQHVRFPSEFYASATCMTLLNMLQLHDHMPVVGINLMISLEMDNLVIRTLGKPGRKRLMKMLLYGQEVKKKVTMKRMKRVIWKKRFEK